MYAAFTDDAKRLADTELMEELIIERGYLAILTALMSKYKPYLEAVEPSKEAPRNPSSGKSEFTRRKKTYWKASEHLMERNLKKIAEFLLIQIELDSVEVVGIL